MTTEKYQPHIDGLRAIAVLGVILFHLKLIPVGHFAVPGGFTGVDVFFVISGFLISRNIFTECDADRFSFLTFYARRARRILPALLVVCCLTMIAGAFILHPVEYDRLARSFLASMALAANLYFYQTANYFGPASSELPLLHLWSLGVEEQFYLLFPLIALALFRLKRSYAVWVYVGLLVGSLAVSQVMAGRNPPAAFYLLPFRAFELLIGCMIALPTFPRMKNTIVAAVVCVIGLLFSGWSYHYLDQPTQFPGWRALPACIGAALVIWSGDKVTSFPAKILGNPIFAFVGRISYSLYLYHWPLLFFVSRLLANTATIGWSVLTLTFAISWLSYRFIETPLRRVKWSSLFTLKVAGASIFTAAVAAMVVTFTGGLAWRVDARIAYYTSFLNYQNEVQFGAPDCFINYLQDFSALAPKCLRNNDKPTVLIWGDSGIAQYSSALAKVINDRGMTMLQATASACPPALDLEIPDRPRCHAFNQEVMRSVIALRPSLIILGAMWGAQMDVYPSVENTVIQLQQLGIRTAVLGLGPGYKFPVPTILADRYRANNTSINSGDDLLRSWSYTTDDAFRARIERLGVRYVSILRNVCPSEECPLLVDGKPVHFDMGHVTQEGANLFVKQFSPQLFLGQ